VGILPKKLQDIYYKYEEKWMYLLFGGLTTVVSIVTKLLFFWIVPGEPKWETTAGVVFSWICAVTFAFFTNKKYVFKNETNGKKEFFKVLVPLD
jgi:putative flippase GtrA